MEGGGYMCIIAGLSILDLIFINLEEFTVILDNLSAFNLALVADQPLIADDTDNVK